MRKTNMLRKLSFALPLAVSLCASSSVVAGPGGCTTAGSLAPFAFETLTISSTALPFTATVYAVVGTPPADMVVATVETDSIRARSDGLAPSATVGQIIYATTTAPASFTVCGTLAIRRTQMIRVTGDATLSIMYYRVGDQ